MNPPRSTRIRNSQALRALASLAVLLAGVACVPALNTAGGALASALGFAAGGTLRLAWDLGWLLLSVFAAVWLPARWSPLWPRGLALGLSIVLVGAVAWAAWTMGGDFPRGFVAALVVGAPVAAAAAMVIAARRHPPTE
jgi:hypothetical protein